MRNMDITLPSNNDIRSKWASNPGAPATIKFSEAPAQVFWFEKDDEDDDDTEIDQGESYQYDYDPDDEVQNQPSSGVSVSNGMTASQLVESTLKKFRVQGANPRNFYLSVLYMDSQERRLEDDDVVLDVLESLRNRSLPGVSDFSKSAENTGEQGTLRLTETNVLRILINKRAQEVIDTIMRPIRIAYHDLTIRQRVVHTVGIPRTATVAEVVDIAIQSFALQPTADEEFNLSAITNSQERLLDPTESLFPIIQIAERRGQELSPYTIEHSATGS
eukprot:jgi/Hompol1/6870/HPOL_002357-RA